MDFFNEVFGFDGQVAIICSIVAAVICLIVVPQDIRQRIVFRFYKYRRTLKFIIRGKLGENEQFIILQNKRNKKVIERYFEQKYDKIYIKILDLRKYTVVKNFILNKQLRKKHILQGALRKIDSQHRTFINAVDCLLIDKSIIYSELYRKKYDYSELLSSIMRYIINESSTDKVFKVAFTYFKTKKNDLTADIEVKISFDSAFLQKYYKKIDDLYFDEFRIKDYISIYNLKDDEMDLWYDIIANYKRNNMDIYDLEIEDYIEYVAPRFYVFISNICEGEWIYSKLNKKQYRVDNFQFDLEGLYKFCVSHNLI